MLFDGLYALPLGVIDRLLIVALPLCVCVCMCACVRACVCVCVVCLMRAESVFVCFIVFYLPSVPMWDKHCYI